MSFPREVFGGKGLINCEQMTDSADIYHPLHLSNQEQRMLMGQDELKDQVKMMETLKDRLKTHGYLLLTNFIPRDEVLTARNQILTILKNENFIRDYDQTLEARAIDPTKSPGLLSRQDVAQLPLVHHLLEHPNINHFFQLFFQEKPLAIKYKWLRAVGKDLFTGVHIDRVYVGGGSEELYTAWIPIGDVSTDLGSLVIADGSHISSQFDIFRHDYAKTKVGTDGTASGWITDDASTLEEKIGKIKWVTTDFKAGDICIINLDVIHLSSRNISNNYRISCDARWQPASHPTFLDIESKSKPSPPASKTQEKPKKRKGSDLNRSKQKKVPTMQSNS